MEPTIETIMKDIREMREPPRLCEYWAVVTPYGRSLIHKKDCKYCEKRKKALRGR